MTEEASSSSGEYSQESYQQSEDDHQVQVKLKDLFGQLVKGGSQQSLSASSFNSENVWSKLIVIAKEDWSQKLNEVYLNELLQKFDANNL